MQFTGGQESREVLGMDERIVQFRVGVVVLATLIITAILIVVFS